MEFIKTKSIMSKVKYGADWFGVDYNMNIYRGCSHCCIYCDSRSDCYHVDNFSVVRSKENVLGILEKELASKRIKGVIGIGSMSDSYNPMEKEYELTRSSLKLISKYNYGISIDTKSDLVVRDIDVLKEISSKNSALIKITITTADNNLSKIIEPNASDSNSRFKTVKTLTDNGVFAGVMMTPVLPFITDSEDNIKEMVRLAYLNGAKFIYTYPNMGVSLRDSQRDYYYRMLDTNFKGLKEKYIKTYGNTYWCLVPNYQHLYKVFTDECEKYGIIYKMSDIIKAYKKEHKTSEQLTLFDI